MLISFKNENECPGDFEGDCRPFGGTKLSKYTVSQPESRSSCLVCPEYGMDYPDDPFCRVDGP